MRPRVVSRDFLRRWALLLFAASFWAFTSPWPSAAQLPLFSDEFTSGPLNTTHWKLSLPYPNAPASSITFTNGAVELFRRAILDAVPDLPAQFDLEARFKFTGDGDTFSIVFRSDLTVTNQFERRGVQVALQETTARVFVIPEPFASTPIGGTYTLGRDTNFNLRVTDNGETVRLFIQDYFQPIISTVVTNHRGHRLSVYNFNGTTCRARLDQIAVYPLQSSIFIDDSLIRTGRVQKSIPARIKFQSIYTNSSIFYTLDGSTPSFAATEYLAPFSLSNSATIRAVAYTPDFLSSSETPAIEFQYYPLVRLTNETRGGGIVTFDPAGPYFSNQVVSVVALPAPGWQFIRWEGAAHGNSVSNQITLTNHVAVRAVFATALNVTIVGNGQWASVPAGPSYEWGVTSRLSAVPNAGNYFVRWANAVTGSVSPTQLVITNPNPAISVLFSPLAANQVSLTLLVNSGLGTVTASPAANVYTNGQSVTLTAQPDLDQVFLRWSGAAAPTGQLSRITLVLTNSTTLGATFAQGIRFLPNSSRYSTNGFLVDMKGGAGDEFDLQQSTNFIDWTRVESLSLSNSGSLQYQHTAATNFPWLFYRIFKP